LRLLVIGDAFTMPEGMEYEYAYPHLLEKKISACIAPRKVQVINAGVTGYGPLEQYPQLSELAPLLKPDIVVYEFFINEFHEQRLTAEERLTNIGLISGNGSIRHRVFVRSQVVAHARQLAARLRELVTGKPGYWRFSKSLLYFYKTGENHFYTEENLALLKSNLNAMNDECRNVSAQFVVFFVPGAVAVSKPADIDYFPWDQKLSDHPIYDLERPYRILRKITDELKIPAIDLTPYLRKHQKQPVYFPGSWHWNHEGHKVVAGAIAQNLADYGLLDQKCKF
jgi:hypothetical protein